MNKDRKLPLFPPGKMQFKSVADTFLSAAEEERKDQRSDRRGRVRARANGENVAKVQKEKREFLLKFFFFFFPPERSL